jgi:hypothetical protein
MTNETPVNQPWFKNKKFIILIAIPVLVVIGQSTGGEEEAPPAAVKNVYDIKPNIFFDDEQNAYAWSPIFKFPASPQTKLTCEAKGLDKDGNSVVADTFPANVHNDGTVIYYGDKRYDTTTKEIAESIASYEISCTED